MLKARLYKLIFFLWLISSLPFGEGWGGVSFAQIYPVQLNTLLTPPFNGHIPDYSTPGNANLKLLVLFTDFTKPAYQIKLKIAISGQGIDIKSKSYYYSQPFTIPPGIPTEISGSDLAGLLSPVNLDISGISPQHYQSKVVPEGFYNICFTAYDYYNPIPIQVSNQSCANGYMVLSEVPFLNLPMCESTVPANTPQNVMFQWTPMNFGSPNSFNTVYDFELYEVRPSTQNPGNIIQTLPPIYQTTIYAPYTQVNYGITEPQLYYGMQYVWRVRARDQSGLDLFKNQGYSQQCTFTYGSVLSQIDSNSLKLNLQAQALTYRAAKCTWDSLGIFVSYRLEYRKQGYTNWFGINTTKQKSNINNLEPENTYEARVKGLFSEGSGPWSNIVTFTTPPQVEIQCGQASVPPSMANFVPLTTGNVGQVWNVGQFDMTVTQLDNPNNATGRYSGYGKVAIPFLGGMSFTVKFTNIAINEAMQLAEGEVVAVSEGMDEWLQQQVLNNANNIDYTYNGSIDSIYIDSNGNIIIIDVNGTTTTQHPTNFPYVIQDSNGDIFTINANGNVTQQQGIPQVNLTQDQKDVYRKALIKLKNDYPVSTISQLQQQKQQKETELNTYLTNTTGVNLQHLTPVNTVDDVLLTEMETPSGTAASNSETDYRTAEFNYLLAKVCRIFSKSTLIDADYNLLANYIIINSKKSYQYIADELQHNKTKDEIAEVLKTEIKVFIEKTIKQYTFAKPD